MRAPKAKPRALGALPQAGLRGKPAETRTAPRPLFPLCPRFGTARLLERPPPSHPPPAVGADPLALASVAPPKPRQPTFGGIQDPPVNNFNLSTGEHGEFRKENVGYEPDHGGSVRTPQSGISKRRIRERQVVANIGFPGGAKGVAVNEIGCRKFVFGSVAPRDAGFPNPVSGIINPVFWGDSTFPTSFLRLPHLTPSPTRGRPHSQNIRGFCVPAHRLPSNRDCCGDRAQPSRLRLWPTVSPANSPPPDLPRMSPSTITTVSKPTEFSLCVDNVPPAD